MAPCSWVSGSGRWLAIGLALTSALSLLLWVGCEPSGTLNPNDNGDGGSMDEPATQVRLETGERGLPRELVAEDVQANLIFSDDARMVEVVIEGREVATTLNFAIDFSDDSLNAALDEWELETGEDLGVLRDWLEANPGRVLAIATGGESLPETTERIKIGPFQQNMGESDVDRHIARLQHTLLVVQRTIVELSRQNRLLELQGSPATTVVARLVFHFVELREMLLADLQAQLRECSFCTSACRAFCEPVEEGACCHEVGNCEASDIFTCQGEGRLFFPGQTCAQIDNCRGILGACCFRESGRTVCEEVTLSTCQSRDGIFNAGIECLEPGGTGVPATKDPCLAACCLTAPAPEGGTFSCCTDLYPEDCEQLAELGGDVTTQYTQGVRCGDPRISCPQCNP